MTTDKTGIVGLYFAINLNKKRTKLIFMKTQCPKIPMCITTNEKVKKYKKKGGRPCSSSR